MICCSCEAHLRSMHGSVKAQLKTAGRDKEQEQEQFKVTRYFTYPG